jgi:hypothetical protein
MSISYNAVWEDTMALTRRHGPLLAAIAGVFIFLPALLVAVFLPPYEPQTQDISRMIELLADWYRASFHWLLLQNLATMVGVAAMLRLVFAERTTVGGALVFALMLLPFYFLLTLLSGLIVFAGFLLLVVPAFYLYARLVVSGAAMVAENRRGPIAAISRSFALTRGQGWRILGLVLIVAIIGVIAVGVASALIGIVLILAAGQELGTLLATIVASAFNTVLSTLFVMLHAALYRALSPQADAEVFA